MYYLTQLTLRLLWHHSLYKGITASGDLPVLLGHREGVWLETCLPGVAHGSFHLAYIGWGTEIMLEAEWKHVLLTVWQRLGKESKFANITLLWGNDTCGREKVGLRVMRSDLNSALSQTWDLVKSCNPEPQFRWKNKDDEQTEWA